MSTVLQKIERAKTGAPTPEEIAHDDKARQHFVKWCDTGKCPHGISASANWHEGLCVECGFNPYNMMEDGEK